MQGTVRPGVPNRRPARYYRLGYLNLGIGGYHPGIQQSGHGEHLLHRTGLVGIADRTVAQVVGIGTVRVI